MKKRKTLGPPPTEADTTDNLSQPEVAPAKLDKRSLRRTGRHTQLNLKVSEDFRDRYEEVARRDRLTNWQLLASALEAYNSLSKEEKESIIEKVVMDDPAMRQAHGKRRMSHRRRQA
jgi:predicted DNA-binding ribbon-helix-helix protein